MRRVLSSPEKAVRFRQCIVPAGDRWRAGSNRVPGPRARAAARSQRGRRCVGRPITRSAGARWSTRPPAREAAARRGALVAVTIASAGREWWSRTGGRPRPRGVAGGGHRSRIPAATCWPRRRRGLVPVVERRSHQPLAGGRWPAPPVGHRPRRGAGKGGWGHWGRRRRLATPPGGEAEVVVDDRHRERACSGGASGPPQARLSRPRSVRHPRLEATSGATPRRARAASMAGASRSSLAFSARPRPRGTRA